MNVSRAPPPQGAPPSYALVTRVYKRSLRPVIIFISFFGGLWALIWGIASFKDISIDKDHAVKLEVFDIVLGALYMAAFAVELLGLVAAFLQNLRMVRVYAFASLGAAVIVTATELMRVIIHFAFKTTLINECVALSNGEDVEERFGLWFHTVQLNSENAPQFCSDAWSHDSFSEIAWFIVTAILSLLFASIAFSYYRQMLDPAFSRVSPARSGATVPAHYDPPYAYGMGGYAGAPETQCDGGYAPPPGPPPPRSARAVGGEGTAYVPQYDPAKLPEYGEDDVADAKPFSADMKGADPFADFTPARSGSGDGSRERERAAEHV